MGAFAGRYLPRSVPLSGTASGFGCMKKPCSRVVVFARTGRCEAHHASLWRRYAHRNFFSGRPAESDLAASDPGVFVEEKLGAVILKAGLGARGARTTGTSR
jgi:hypothetical protein